jgi:uncharacterized protein (DUF488 family)
MQTPEFRVEIDWLMQQIAASSVTVMCAEAVPWRCHRSLIADAVLARGTSVEDIFISPDGTHTRKSRGLTSFARAEAGRLCYPGSGPGELFG